MKKLLAGLFLFAALPCKADITSILSMPGSSTGTIQFNQNYSFQGDPAFTYSTTTKRVILSTGGIQWPDGTVQVSSPPAGGGGGTPGGSNREIQFNNAGVFGGSSVFTYDVSGSSVTLITQLGAGGIQAYADGFALTGTNAIVLTLGNAPFGSLSPKYKFYVQDVTSFPSNEQILGGISDSADATMVRFGKSATAVGGTPYLDFANLQISGYQNLASTFTSASHTGMDIATTDMIDASGGSYTITLPDIDVYSSLAGVYVSVRPFRYMRFCKTDASTNTITFAPTTAVGDLVTPVPTPLRYRNECQEFQATYILKVGAGNPASVWTPIGRTAGQGIAISSSGPVAFMAVNDTNFTSFQSSRTLAYNQRYVLFDSTGAVDQVASIRSLNADGTVSLYWKTDATGGAGGGTTIWVQDNGSAFDNAVSTLSFSQSGGFDPWTLTQNPAGKVEVRISTDIVAYLASTQTFTGAITVVSSFTVLGDLLMGNQTAGRIIVANGTKYDDVDMSGDVDVDGAGVTTVANDSHDHTGATISGIDVSDDTNLTVEAPILLVGDQVRIDKSSATLLGPGITLGAETDGVYVASLTVVSPIVVTGTNNVESAAPTLALNQHAGTDVTADLEEETHVTEHQDGGADELNLTGLSGIAGDPQKVAVSTGTSVIAVSTLTAFVAGSNMTITAEQNTSSTTIRFASSGGGGGVSVDSFTYTFTPLQLTASTSTLGVQNSTQTRSMLLFDGSSHEWAEWQSIKLFPYNGGALTADIAFTMASATSGGVTWGVQLECITTGDSADYDTASFDATNSTSGATVPATAGHLKIVSVPLTNADSCAASDSFRVRVNRFPADAGDTNNTDAEFRWVAIRE